MTRKQAEEMAANINGNGIFAAEVRYTDKHRGGWVVVTENLKSGKRQVIRDAYPTRDELDEAQKAAERRYNVQ